MNPVLALRMGTGGIRESYAGTQTAGCHLERLRGLEPPQLRLLRDS